ncbi:hypothetical protein [Teredinibacter turnerae]|uniref:hypothetical protein n=1 Tax=Teredinibacter turnerae TaxID=2426 RepID=UPI000490B6E6|nr:hypothetical protein [Teredinibacter turnerae]
MVAALAGDCLQQSAELRAHLDALRTQNRALPLAMQAVAQLLPNPALSLGYIRHNQQQTGPPVVAGCPSTRSRNFG